MPCLDILDVMCAHNSMNLLIYALPWNNFKVERYANSRVSAY